MHHSRGLRKLLEAEARAPDEIDQLIESLVHSSESVSLSAADRVLLDFSIKLTATPEKIKKADADALHDAGFDDLAIHDIVCCVSYFAFVNRIADGLGVELERGKSTDPDS